MDYEKTFKITITGRTPLLMHKDAFLADDDEDSGAALRGKGKKGDDRHPASKWQSYVYSDGTHVVMPGRNLMASLLEAGKKLKIGRSSLKVQSQSAIGLSNFAFPLLVGGKKVKIKDIEKLRGEFPEQMTGAEALGFELSIERVRIGTARHVRVRPMFRDWSVEIEATVDMEELSEKQFIALWETAGRKAGLCDWRPSCQKPGQFGLFSANVVSMK